MKDKGRRVSSLDLALYTPEAGSKQLYQFVAIGIRK